MHPNLIHPNQSLPLSHSYPPPSTGPVHPASKRPRAEDDEEIVAKKKKNADAQAAFRLRRQTYIKSLEDTVSELKNAVSEMEVLVKTANHDVKLQRERVAFLDAKLKQANQGSSEPMNEGSGSSHCTCCRYAPPLDQPQHHNNRLPASTSPTSLINPTTPTVPTPVSTPAHTPQTIQHQRDWPTHPRSYSSVFVSQPHPPRANSPQQPAYNRLLHRHQTNEQHDPAGNSNYGTIFFEPFTTSTPTTAPFYHPSLDIHHHHHHSSSSPPLDSPRTAAYLGVHQPTSRAWPDYGMEQQKQSYKHDETRLYTDDQQQQKRRREEEGGGVIKLNGLPAKVARCNQAVMEVSKVVEQAKLATAAGVGPTKFEFGGAGVV